MPPLTPSINENLRLLHDRLRVHASFDIVVRHLRVADAQAGLFYIAGLMKEEMVTAVLYHLAQLTPPQRLQAADMGAFVGAHIPYGDVNVEPDADALVQAVLSGRAALVLDGFPEALLINARQYPSRSMSEPETDRILRGAHEGFVESVAVNAALIRRHIRDPRLSLETVQVGSVSHTDILLCYMDGVAEAAQVEGLRKKLQAITIPSLCMAQESLEECLLRKQQWYNPFPKIRYTERPDAAAATLLEGRILLLIDNSPAAMILPTGIFDFIQDTNDYSFPPLIGTYLRFTRLIVFVMTIFLTPVWYFLMTTPQFIPSWLEFIRIKEPGSLPILLQLLVVELMIEAIKMASMNTPSGLSSAFGMVGTLIFGQFAVEAGLLAPEILLYMSIVAIGNFTQSSFELGYAFKLCRILLLLCVGALQAWGFLLGLGLMVFVLATTETVLGGSYLYPLVPFNAAALRRLLTRRLLHRHNVMK